MHEYKVMFTGDASQLIKTLKDAKAKIIKETDESFSFSLDVKRQESKELELIISELSKIKELADDDIALRLRYDFNKQKADKLSNEIMPIINTSNFQKAFDKQFKDVGPSAAKLFAKEYIEKLTEEIREGFGQMDTDAIRAKLEELFNVNSYIKHYSEEDLTEQVREEIEAIKESFSSADAREVENRIYELLNTHNVFERLSADDRVQVENYVREITEAFEDSGDLETAIKKFEELLDFKGIQKKLEKGLQFGPIFSQKKLVDEMLPNLDSKGIFYKELLKMGPKQYDPKTISSISAKSLSMQILQSNAQKLQKQLEEKGIDPNAKETTFEKITIQATKAAEAASAAKQAAKETGQASEEATKAAGQENKAAESMNSAADKMDEASKKVEAAHQRLHRSTKITFDTSAIDRMVAAIRELLETINLITTPKYDLNNVNRSFRDFLQNTIKTGSNTEKGNVKKDQIDAISDYLQKELGVEQVATSKGIAEQILKVATTELDSDIEGFYNELGKRAVQIIAEKGIDTTSLLRVESRSLNLGDTNIAGMAKATLDTEQLREFMDAFTEVQRKAGAVEAEAINIKGFAEAMEQFGSAIKVGLPEDFNGKLQTIVDSLNGLSDKEITVKGLAEAIDKLGNSMNIKLPEDFDAKIQKIIDSLIQLSEIVDQMHAHATSEDSWNSTNIEKIIDLLGQLLQMINKVNDAMSNTRLDQRFKEIGEAAELLGNGNLNKVNGGYKRLQEIVEMYNEYRQFGGMNKLSDLSSNEKLTAKLQQVADEMQKAQTDAEKAAFKQQSDTVKSLKEMTDILSGANLQDIIKQLKELHQILNAPVDQGSFLKELQALAGYGQALSDLATVLNATGNQIKTAKKAVTPDDTIKIAQRYDQQLKGYYNRNVQTADSQAAWNNIKQVIGYYEQMAQTGQKAVPTAEAQKFKQYLEEAKGVLDDFAGKNVLPTDVIGKQLDRLDKTINGNEYLKNMFENRLANERASVAGFDPHTDFAVDIKNSLASLEADVKQAAENISKDETNILKSFQQLGKDASAFITQSLSGTASPEFLANYKSLMADVDSFSSKYTKGLSQTASADVMKNIDAATDAAFTRIKTSIQTHLDQIGKTIFENPYLQNVFGQQGQALSLITNQFANLDLKDGDALSRFMQHFKMLGDNVSSESVRIKTATDHISQSLSVLSGKEKEFISLTASNPQQRTIAQTDSINNYIQQYKQLQTEVANFEQTFGYVPKNISDGMSSLTESIQKSLTNMIGVSKAMDDAFNGGKYTDKFKAQIDSLRGELTTIVDEVKNFDTSNMWDIDKVSRYAEKIEEVRARFRALIANASGEDLIANNIVKPKDLSDIDNLKQKIASIGDVALQFRFDALSKAFANFDPAKKSISALRKELNDLKKDVDTASKTTSAAAAKQKKDIDEISNRFKDLKKSIDKNNLYDALLAGDKKTDYQKGVIDAFIKEYEQLLAKVGSGQMPAGGLSFNEFLSSQLTQVDALRQQAEEMQNSREYADAYKNSLQELIQKTEELHTVINDPSFDPSKPWDPKKIEEYLTAYLKLQDAIKAGNKDESRNVSLTSVNSILAKTKATYNSITNNDKLKDDLKVIINDLESVSKEATDAGSNMTTMSKTDFSAIVARLKELDGQVSETGAKARTFAAAFGDAMMNQTASMFAQFMSIRYMMRYIRQIASTVTEVDSAITELRKVSGASNARLQESFKTSAATAQELGATITDVINSTADWARLGYGIDQAEDLARVTQLLQTVGDNMTQETASKSLVSILQGFKIDASQAERTVDSINEVANNFAIDTAGIGDALQRSAAALNASGTNLNKSIALVTTSNAVLQNPETVGTMFKTLSARIRGATTELSELGEEEDEFTKTTSKLRNLVLQLTDFDIMKDENTFKDIYDILVGIGEKWNTLTDIEQASLGEALGGKRGINALYAVLNNIEGLKAAYKTAEGAAGSAAREQEAYTQSVQYSIDRVKASVQELSVTFLDSKLLKNFLEGANSLLKIVQDIVATIGSRGSIITTLLGTDLLSGLLGGRMSISGAAVKAWATTMTGENAEATIGKNLTKIFKTQGAQAGAAGGVSAIQAFGKALTSGSAAAWAGVGLAAVAVIGIIYSAIKQRQKELLDTAKASAEEWKRQQKSVNDNFENVRELRAKLDSGKLSDEEQLEVKKQIYEIQKQITEEYGKAASGVDLINGRLETERDLLTEIAERQAKANLIENASAYSAARNVATKEKSGLAADLVGAGPELQNEIRSVISKNNLHFKTRLSEGDYGRLIVDYDGSYKEISEDVEKLTYELDNLREKYKDEKRDLMLADPTNAKAISDQYNDQINVIDEAIESITSQTKKIRSEYKDIKDTYESYLEQKFFADGGGRLATEVAKNIDEINNALLEGDTDTLGQNITEYYSNLAAIREKAIENEWSNDDIDDYIASITSGFNKSSLKAFDFADVLTKGSERYAENQFKTSATYIQKMGEEVLKAGIDAVDVEKMLSSKDITEGGIEETVQRLATEFGWLGDGTAEDKAVMESFIQVLSDLGIIFGGVEQRTNQVVNSFKNFKTEITQAYAALDSVNSALASSVTAKGLGIEYDSETGDIAGDIGAIINAYKDLDGYNAAELFYSTANGVKVNQKALHKLQAEQDKVTRKKFLKQQRELTMQLMAAEKARNAAASAEDVAKYDKEISSVRQALQELGYLKAAYDGATSAYQKWLNAQSAGEAGDIYDNILKTALPRVKELYEANLVGTEEFRTLIGLFTGLDTATMSAVELAEAYNQINQTIDGTKYKITDFLQEGTAGTDAFAQALIDLGHATSEDGWVVFDYLNTDELAAQMGTSVDVIEAILNKMNDFGAELKWMSNEQAEAFKDIETRAEHVKDTLNFVFSDKEKRKMQRGLSFDLFNVDSMETVEDLNAAEAQIRNIFDHPAEFQINDSQAEALNKLLDLIIEKRNVIETPTIDVITVESYKEVEKNIDDLQDRLKEFYKYSAKHPFLDISNEKEIQQLAEWIASLPDELKKEFHIEPDATTEEIIRQFSNGGYEVYEKQHVDKTTVETNSTTWHVEYSEAESAYLYMNMLKESTPDELATQIVCETYGVQNVEQLYTLIGEEEGEHEVEVVAKALNEEDVEALAKEINGIHDKRVKITAEISQLTTFQVWWQRLNLDKTITLNYKSVNAPNNDLATPSHDKNGARVNGTAHAMGTAYTGGRWGLPSNQKALVNEVGPEIVVRGSNWFIPNNGRPTMGYPLKKGDIVFNAKQTEELLKNGYITHGYAHANGTYSGPAYAGVNGKYPTGGLNGSTGDKDKDKGSSDKSKSSNDKAVTQAAEKAAAEIKDWIEVMLNNIARVFENHKEMAEYWTSYINQNRELNTAIQKAQKNITTNQEAYAKYLKQAESVGLKGYEIDYAKRVREGALTIQSISDEKLREKIENYNEWYSKAQACSDTIRELNKELIELSRQKIDNLIEDYESFTETLEKAYEYSSKLNDLSEKRTGLGSVTELQSMLGINNEKIAEYTEARKRIQKEVNSQIKQGLMTVGSKEYLQAMNDIKELDNLILDTQLDNYGLIESIREINWAPFNEGLAVLEHMNSQLDSTISILGDLTAYNKNGTITGAGTAQFDLNASGLANARKKIAEYDVAIKTLKKELKDGTINQAQYNEQLREYTEAQMDAVSEAKGYRDAILSLIKDGIEAETSAMEELINKRKEALQRQKEADNYSKTVNDKTKEINSIRAQIAALSGDDTLAAQAKMAKLRADLASKEEDLESTRRDHRYDEMSQAYDDELEAFKETQQEKIDSLSESLASQEEAIKSALSWTTSQYKTTLSEINKIAKEYGITFETFLTDPWKSGSKAAKEYKDATTKATSSTKIATNNYSPNTLTGVREPTDKESIAGWSPFSGATLSKGAKNKVSDVNTLQALLKFLGYKISMTGSFGQGTEDIVKLFQKEHNLSQTGKVGGKTMSTLISVARAHGYLKSGKRNATGLYITDEEGIGSEAIITKEGVLRQLDSDTVFSKKQTDALWNLSKMSVSNLFSNASRIVPHDSNVNVHYDSLLTVNGNVDKDALPGLKEILKQACEYTKNDMRSTFRKMGISTTI